MKFVLLLVSLFSAAVMPSPWAQKADPDALLVQDFEDRVKDYVKLHTQVEATLPALKLRWSWFSGHRKGPFLDGGRHVLGPE